MTVARGPSFFSLLFRKAGGWIVSRLLNTAWMEGMVAARDGRALAVSVVGAALVRPSSPPVQTTKLPPRVRHGVLLPFRKSPVTTAGAPRAARKTERWESLTGGFMV